MIFHVTPITPQSQLEALRLRAMKGASDLGEDAGSECAKALMHKEFARGETRRRLAVLYHRGATPDCPLPAERATLLGMIPRVTRLLTWEGDLPDVGEYLETKSGAIYVVIAVKPNLRPGAKSVARLDILRLEADDEIQSSRKRHPFRWIGGRRKR